MEMRFSTMHVPMVQRVTASVLRAAMVSYEMRPRRAMMGVRLPEMAALRCAWSKMAGNAAVNPLSVGQFAAMGSGQVTNYVMMVIKTMATLV